MTSIISIHSFRGGTGKSNITANLAVQLALRGKRVAVVDTDIQSPGIHVLFGLDGESIGYTLNDYLHGGCMIEQVAYPLGRKISALPEGHLLAKKSLWLVPSSIKSAEISDILKNGYDVNQLNKGLNNLCTQLKLDFLLIDTHPGLNEETLLSLLLSDVLLLILRPDQQDFQGTAVTVDIARSLDVPDLRLVVNKALTKYDFTQMAEEFESVFEAPVVGVLPLSEDLADLGSANPFSLCNPDHPWSQGIFQIAQSLAEHNG